MMLISAEIPSGNDCFGMIFSKVVLASSRMTPFFVQKVALKT